MDLIERIFHISPDNGSGTLEAVLMLMAFLIPIAIPVLRKLKRPGILTGSLRAFIQR